jgi:tRNA pseudouridine38-40 synthase
MRRIRLTVAYDGTNYCGWQIQPNGITIEEVLNKAICKLTGEEIQVIGASRTDSGVHARGNIAVFDTESRIPAERFSYALNQRLPKDIVVVKSDEVDLNWHPRYQDTLKTYEYHIINTKVPIPTERLYNYFAVPGGYRQHPGTPSGMYRDDGFGSGLSGRRTRFCTILLYPY